MYEDNQSRLQDEKYFTIYKTTSHTNMTHVACRDYSEFSFEIEKSKN